MPKEKERGALLSIWLLLMFFANLASALFYLLAMFWPRVISKPTPAPAIYFFFAMSSINIILTIFLFRWKKWPFFVFCAVATITFLLNIFVGVPTSQAIFGLLGPLILYLLLRSKWDLLE